MTQKDSNEYGIAVSKIRNKYTNGKIKSRAFDWSIQFYVKDTRSMILSCSKERFCSIISKLDVISKGDFDGYM